MYFRPARIYHLDICRVSVICRQDPLDKQPCRLWKDNSYVRGSSSTSRRRTYDFTITSSQMTPRAGTCFHQSDPRPFSLCCKRTSSILSGTNGSLKADKKLHKKIFWIYFEQLFKLCPNLPFSWTGLMSA